jgi:hypothetical protein
MSELKADNARLDDALVCVDARLQMLARDAGNGTVLYAVIALRDLIRRARGPA